MHTTKIFCPRCGDIYYPRSSRQANVDGAYFGTTFCHLFLNSFWELSPAPPAQAYTPRIFGFKLHKSAPGRGPGAVHLPPAAATTAGGAAGGGGAAGRGSAGCSGGGSGGGEGNGTGGAPSGTAHAAGADPAQLTRLLGKAPEAGVSK